jgi:uncharacterized membrane protein YvbJ
MALINCKECGSLVVKNKTDFCAQCQSENELYFSQMRQYLRKHPQCTVWEMSQKTGIPLAKILKLNKAEYFTFQ